MYHAETALYYGGSNAPARGTAIIRAWLRQTVGLAGEDMSSRVCLTPLT